MDLNHMREFVFLTESRSYSKTADDLFISQSTLSKHIMALEKELGGKLFNRSTRTLDLSPLGQLFLPYAKQTVEIMNRCDTAVDDFHRMNSASFTIGVVRNLQYYSVIKYLVGFTEKYPDCRINVMELDEKILSEMFVKGTLNLITAALPLEYTSKTHFAPIAEGHLVAVVPPTHPLFEKKSLTLQDFANEPLIVPERDAVFSDIIKNAFRAQNIVPNIVYEGSSAGALDFAKAGMGISIQSKELVEGQQDETLCPKEILPQLSYHYGLLYREAVSLSMWEKRFVNYVSDFDNQ